MIGNIYDIQPFSIHDGPGTRTTVFLQGCPLRCRWCHNPESQPLKASMMFYPNRCIGCGECAKVCPNGTPARFTESCTLCGKCVENCFADAIKISGYTIDSGDLAKELIKDRDVYKKSGGGVTFSGGEPALQPDFIIDTVRQLGGIHTAIETCCCVKKENIEKLAEVIDFFYVDLKCISEEVHVANTGASNKVILDNIRYLSEHAKKLVLRTPIVPTFNANDKEIALIADFVNGLPQKHSCELLAYHSMCKPKYAAVNREFPMGDTKEPSKADMEFFLEIFISRGIDTIYRM